jgi:hypothetical protein
MLLFEHPVNRSRESRGRSPVNYIWMWGGGTLGAANRAKPAAALFAEAPLVRDLALAAGMGAATVPISFAALRAASPAASALVWFEGFDASAARELLAAFDADWAAPLERAIDDKEIEATLVIAGSATALSFAPRAARAMQRLRRRWSRPPNLSPLLAPHADG